MPGTITSYKYLLLQIHFFKHIQFLFFIFLQNFLLSAMLQIGIAPKVVRNGQKVFLLEIEELGIKFLRSNNYFDGNEYKMASLFNIAFEKNFFPARFQNVIYKGDIPNESFFFEFTDSKEIREEKIKFLTNFKKNNSTWEFSKEILKYSEEKLNILSLAFLKFIEESFLFQNLLQHKDESKLIHPMGNNVSSISSFIYKVFRLFYLNSYDIYAIKNEFGGNLAKQVSAQENEWSSYMQFIHPEREYRSAFSHPLGAKIFNNCVPDLYSAKTKEALFYNGCFYHAHMHECLLNPNASPQTNHPLFKESYQQINDNFNKKIAMLLANNPLNIEKVTIIWECEYLKQKTTNLDLKTFLSTTFKERPLERLRPRTAIRGSLTECFALKWLKSENQNEIFYCLDINGMYSHIAMTSKFPIGPYKILLGKDVNDIAFKSGQFFYKDIQNPMVGVMMISILPPKDLFFPFLPYKLKDETTVFSLCLKCAENQNQTCNHSDDERSFTSVYFISEIIFALELGYKINEIYECHYFEQSDFILKDFIKTLACLRFQNSDLFSDCTTFKEKQSYCDYLNKQTNFNEPFVLNVQDIHYNKSKQFMYKKMMNSIFGKLEQRSDKPKTVYVTSQEEIEQYYFSDSIITSIFCLNENLCELEIKTDNEKLPPNRENNSYIGGELVALGRILIYKTIQQIDLIGKVFYVDCDSCYFTLPITTKMPLEISDCFGAFKNVYPGEILSFFCIAPKNYAITFKAENNQVKHVTKIKGLSLSSFYLENEINSATFNFFLSKYLNDEIEKKQIAQIRCRKDKKTQKTTNKLEIVRFSNQICNRRIVVKKCKYVTTVPYGFTLKK